MLDFGKIRGFQWDQGNIDKSYAKHGITPNEAEEILLDEDLQADPDNLQAAIALIQHTANYCVLTQDQYLKVIPVAMNIDIITPGQDGILADSKGEWTSALSELISDSEKRRQMGKAGRKKVEERFNTAQAARNLLTIMADQ